MIFMSFTNNQFIIPAGATQESNVGNYTVNLNLKLDSTSYTSNIIVAILSNNT